MNSAVTVVRCSLKIPTIKMMPKRTPYMKPLTNAWTKNEKSIARNDSEKNWNDTVKKGTIVDA